MKKYLLSLFILLIIPFNAYAYELICDNGPVDYNNSFNCYIKGDNTIEYDDISGSFEKNSYYTCSAVDSDNGLTSVNLTDGFKFKGLSNSEELIKITCTLTAKPSATGSEQIIIPDFKYHKLDDNNDASTEVLRSNNISYNAYIEQIQKKDNKPRNTDYPDSRLRDIKDENLDFTFSTFKTEYEISVKYEVDKISPVITTTNSDATLNIEGSYDLEIGENIIDIYVTSPSGEHVTCYTLKITRLKRGEEIYYIEKDSSLASLSIEGYNINFESVVHEYNIRINYNVDNIKVSAEATNPDADVTISNTSGLKNGDVVNVTVTSEDKSVSTIYSIRISKNAPPKNNKNSIVIIVLIVSISVVILLIIITNVKNKGNPLLKKKEVKTLDKNDVPDANKEGNIIPPSNEVVQPESVEVLNTEQTTQVAPSVPVQPQVVPEQVVQPQPVVNTPVEPQVVNQPPVEVVNNNSNVPQPVVSENNIPSPPPAPTIEEHKEVVETNIFN